MFSKCSPLALGLLCIALLVFISPASALRCHVCGPSTDCEYNYDRIVNCGNFFESPNNPLQFVCVKHRSGYRTTRGCFVETFCNNLSDCHICYGDLCNGAGLQSISKLTLLSTTFFAVLYKFFHK